MPTAPLNLMGHTITVERSTTTVDSGGSPVTAWATHLDCVQASVQQLSGSESVRYGAERNRRAWRLFIPTPTDITEKDRVKFNDRSSGALVQRTFDIQQAINPTINGTVVELICEETT